MENQSKDKSIEELIHIVVDLSKEVTLLKANDKFREELIKELRESDKSKDEKINNIEKNVLKMTGDLEVVITFINESKKDWKANDAVKKNNIYKVATDLVTSLLKFIGGLITGGFIAKYILMGGK